MMGSDGHGAQQFLSFDGSIQPPSWLSSGFGVKTWGLTCDLRVFGMLPLAIPSQVLLDTNLSDEVVSQESEES